MVTNCVSRLACVTLASSGQYVYHFRQEGDVI